METTIILFLTGRHICHYLMERIMDLQQKKKHDWQGRHLFICLVDFVQFLPKTNFVHSAFEDCLIWGKICKIMTNHAHLLSLGDDRNLSK